MVSEDSVVVVSISAACSLHVIVEIEAIPCASVKGCSRAIIIFPYHFPMLVEYIQNVTLIFCRKQRWKPL